MLIWGELISGVYTRYSYVRRSAHREEPMFASLTHRILIPNATGAAARAVRSVGSCAVVLFLAACSSSGGGGDAASAVNQLAAGVKQGFFRGGNVNGLEFVSGRQSGITDADGAYTCEEDRPVSFSVGSVRLGETECASMVHAAALTESGSVSDPAAINITRFLMTLDQDSNPNNGVIISEALRTMAANWPQIDFSADDFDNELVGVISDIMSIDSRVASVPDSAAAFVFLDASVACAYSGVFINIFSAGAFNATTVATVNVFRERETNIDLANFLMIRQHPQSSLFTESTAEFMLETLPGIRDDYFIADYLSPDQVAGSWLKAASFQSVDTTGTYNAFRLGRPGGEYRFTGKLVRDRERSFDRTLQGRIELYLDGDTMIGRGIDHLLGVRLPVEGRRIGDTNDFELEVENYGTSTVTLILDDDGEPAGLEGGWPRIEGNVLEAVGCRLL